MSAYQRPKYPRLGPHCTLCRSTLALKHCVPSSSGGNPPPHPSLVDTQPTTVRSELPTLVPPSPPTLRYAIPIITHPSLSSLDTTATTHTTLLRRQDDDGDPLKRRRLASSGPSCIFSPPIFCPPFLTTTYLTQWHAYHDRSISKTCGVKRRIEWISSFVAVSRLSERQEG